MIRNSETYEDRVTILRFEDLVDKTEPVLRVLAEFLQIESVSGEIYRQTFKAAVFIA
jgi:hypothetical protein